jgi:hypothetical protein
VSTASREAREGGTDGGDGREEVSGEDAGVAARRKEKRGRI